MNVVKQYPGSGMYAITWFAAIDHLHVERNKMLTLEQIFNELCHIFKQPGANIRAKDRHRDMVKIRQIYCYVSYGVGQFTLHQIGQFINRDHTTVIHSKDTVVNYIHVKDPMFMRFWNYYIARTKIYVLPKRKTSQQHGVKIETNLDIQP